MLSRAGSHHTQEYIPSNKQIADALRKAVDEEDAKSYTSSELTVTMIWVYPRPDVTTISKAMERDDATYKNAPVV